MKAQLLLMMICLIFTANLIAQQVSGTVKDENGEALIGVTILEKGTTNGTVTDLDGHYTIQVSENASLYFSYIGFQSQEVLVDGKTSIDIVLISGIELVEVIVLGYQEKSKEEVTGSVSVINSKL
jgi:hypothetical protein